MAMAIRQKGGNDNDLDDNDEIGTFNVMLKRNIIPTIMNKNMITLKMVIVNDDDEMVIATMINIIKIIITIVTVLNNYERFLRP